MEIAPIILETATIQHPAPSFQGCKAVLVRGKGMSLWLKGHEEQLHKQSWDCYRLGAIRKGN